jgi:hypothetical protein
VRNKIYVLMSQNIYSFIIFTNKFKDKSTLKVTGFGNIQDGGYVRIHYAE